MIFEARLIVMEINLMKSVIASGRNNNVGIQSCTSVKPGKCEMLVQLTRYHMHLHWVQ
jgi:hypothetical protein